MILNCCGINLKNICAKIILPFNSSVLRNLGLIRSNIKSKMTEIIKLKNFIMRINIREMHCIDSISRISDFFIYGIYCPMNYALFHTYVRCTYCGNWQLNQKVLNLCK